MKTKTKMFLKCSLVLYILLLGVVLSDEPGEKPPEKEEEAETDDTTIVYVEHTDLPQSDIDDALQLEDGEYSTVSFQYINDQFIGWQNVSTSYSCYDDYIKCTISQAVRQPVCAVNKNDKWNYIGVRTLPSICDMYLDNCRRRDFGMR